MSKNYTEQELNDLINKVELQFASDLAKAETVLKTTPLKKNDEEVVEEKEEQDQDISPVCAVVEEQKEDKQDQDTDYREYDEEELEELAKLYESMDPKELSHHHGAIKKALGVEENSFEMNKSESMEEFKLQKSELETLKKSNDDLKKAISMITENLNKKKVIAPKQQAIAELGVLAKSEDKKDKQPDRKDVVRQLNKVAETPDLQKSDREAINRYCTGSGTLESIKHLLK